MVNNRGTGRKSQRGPAARLPARKKQKTTSSAISTSAKKTRFRDTVCEFDDDAEREAERQNSNRSGGRNNTSESSLLGGSSIPRSRGEQRFRKLKELVEITDQG